MWSYCVAIHHPNTPSDDSQCKYVGSKDVPWLFCCVTAAQQEQEGIFYWKTTYYVFSNFRFPCDDVCNMRKSFCCPTGCSCQRQISHNVTRRMPPHRPDQLPVELFNHFCTAERLPLLSWSHFCINADIVFFLAAVDYYHWHVYALWSLCVVIMPFKTPLFFSYWTRRSFLLHVRGDCQIYSSSNPEHLRFNVRESKCYCLFPRIENESKCCPKSPH